MPQFPHREADIKALAQQMINGMTENPDFPSPPFSASDLRNALDEFTAAGDTQRVSYATAQQDTEIKRTKREVMLMIMKSILHYAEDITHDNDAKLSTLGWGARAEYTTHPLEIPGQPSSFTVLMEAEDTVSFGWQEPADGGEVATYELQRRERGEGASTWIIAGISFETRETLPGQERGKELEYRVISANKAGRSLPSNTVAVVL
jgi:hypothetical protein